MIRGAGLCRGSHGVVWAVVTFTPPEPTNNPTTAVAVTVMPRQDTVMPRQDPITTPEAAAFILALGRDKVAIEPPQALFLGHAVCGERANHATLAGLSARIRQYIPEIRPMDAAMLADDADRQLCQAGK